MSPPARSLSTTGPHWFERPHRKWWNTAPGRSQGECLSLYLSPKTTSSCCTSATLPPLLAPPTATYQKQTQFQIRPGRMCSGGRNGELRASQHSSGGREGKSKPGTIGRRVFEINFDSVNWKWVVFPLFLLPVVPADETVKGLGKMLQSSQPGGHRLQILVKLSAPRRKTRQ